jgi:chemotaxis protein methyltransferase CheR
MKNNDCVQFLQWALPQLHMRWPGFRKVRSQVCKRIDRRLRQLAIDDIQTYRNYLQQHKQEWQVLDELSRITISRFYRDRAVFEFLTQQVFPELAKNVLMRHDKQLKVWCAGCASGEEAYTLSLIWLLQLQAHFADLKIAITATDVSADIITRARRACYAYSSVKNLPAPWREQAFRTQQQSYCLKPVFQQPVRFLQQDIRRQIPDDCFDLIVCRNLVFTYFDTPMQCRILEQIEHAFNPGGALIIGIHESLPPCATQFSICSERLKVFRKTNHKQSSI